MLAIKLARRGKRNQPFLPILSERSEDTKSSIRRSLSGGGLSNKF